MGSPLVLDIGTLLAAGRPMSLDERVEVPSHDSYAFPVPAHARLEFRRIGRGVAVTGTIDVEAQGECGRCLDGVAVPVSVEVNERFDAGDGPIDPFGENNVLDGTRLDVSDLVRQLIQSALPYSALCRDDCAGLCDRCGRSRNDGGGCDCLPPAET